MNLQQLRYLRETVRRGLNLTLAAEALHTSQPGLSKAIRELEDELGVTIFVRQGKRLAQLTGAGRDVVAIAERVLVEIDNLKHSARDWRDADSGTLRLAATHTQARYSLPHAIAQLRARYPQVSVRLHQGSPVQIIRMLRDGVVDLGVATESLGSQDDLESEELFSWYHLALAPRAHPLCALDAVALEDLAEHDLISYDPEFAGRAGVDAAFAARDLRPNFVLEATDSDVIKTYVRLGLGVGIVSELAYRNGKEDADDDLVSLPIGHPFPRNTSRIARLRGRQVRGYEQTLVELLKRP